ncbi:MAG TPA: hypothetical protein VGP72_15100 [Planctomycetota bacterium]
MRVRRFALLATALAMVLSFSAAATNVGDTAPEISATSWVNSSKSLSMASTQGHVRVIEFWATW